MTKWSEFSVVTTLDDADKLPLLDDVGPSNKTITVANVFAQIGAAPVPKWRTDYWYGTPQGGAATTYQPGEGVLMVQPLLIPAGLALSGIGHEVTIAGTVGALVRVGVYRLSETGIGATLEQDVGAIAATATGVVEQALSIAADTRPWWALLALAVQGAAGTRPTFRGISASVQQAPMGVATLAAGMTRTSFNGFSSTGVSGALPASTSTINESAFAPRLLVKGTQA